MRVQIIAHTPEPEQVVAAAARLLLFPSRSRGAFGAVKRGRSDKAPFRLEESGHLSPLSMSASLFHRGCKQGPFPSAGSPQDSLLLPAVTAVCFSKAVWFCHAAVSERRGAGNF